MSLQKLFALSATLALAVSMVSPAVAGAETAAELQAQIAALRLN